MKSHCVPGKLSIKHSFILLTNTIEYLLCARYHMKFWGNHNKQERDGR